MNLLIDLWRYIKNKIKMSWEQYFANVANIVKSGYRSNAFAPYVWFCAIVIPFLIAAILLIKDPRVTIVVSIAICFVILFASVMYFVLFQKDPKLLQSENYRIEDRKLDLIEQKGGDLIVNPIDMILPMQLEKGEGHG